jgi:hypothetical protein
MTVTYLSDHPRFKQVREAPMSKAQLAKAIGFSTRWIEQRHHDGLPVEYRSNGQAQYWLSEVNPWLQAWLDRRNG